MLKQISASAGSGKTYTLTSHFLELLKKASKENTPSSCTLFSMDSGYPRVYGLGEILAATFTNKAAAEMKNRIIDTLKAEALTSIGEEKKTSSAESWLSTIFRNYSALNVRTIDSLLSLLVRLSALELDLPPDFTPSFDKEEYFTPVYDAFMADLTTFRLGQDTVFFTNDGDTLLHTLEKTCKSLILVNEIEGFRVKNQLYERLFELVDRKLKRLSLPYIDNASLHKQTEVLYKEFLNSATNLLSIIKKEQLKLPKHFQNYLNNTPATERFKGPKETAYLTKDSIESCLNKESQGKASHEAEHAFLSLKKTYQIYKNKLPLIKSALYYSDLIPLANELHERLIMHMRSSGLLPVTLLPILARTILQDEFGVSDALCRMGTNLTYMLLDEFQDTSIDQWQAIMPLAVESLSHGGAITYVGDVKQAIYGWRGGEASLFTTIAEEKELLAITQIAHQESLPYNWRSSKAVVQHNNAFFSLLADQNIAYETLQAMLPAGTPKKYIQQATEIITSVYKNSEQRLPKQKLASEGCVKLYHVAADSQPELYERVQLRLSKLFTEELCLKYTYENIAVLVRTSTEERLIASWLTELNIPVVTENSFLLAAQPLVSRLISFLTFLDYPFDDLAFWEFISGPECFGCISGRTRTEMESWAASLGNRSGVPLFRLFRSAYPKEWKYFIEPFYNQAGLMSAYDLLSEIIHRFDLFTTDIAPFLRRVLEVAHLAEEKGFSSLASFLDFWKGSEEEEKLPLPETMNAVRIMTMHKAKGLEFPVVVIPFHHSAKRGKGKLVESELDNQPALLIAGKELPACYYPDCITEDLERLNLLYVAWTRPINELHAFLTHPKNPTPLTNGIDKLMEVHREKHSDLFIYEDVCNEQEKEERPFDSSMPNETEIQTNYLEFSHDPFASLERQGNSEDVSLSSALFETKQEKNWYPMDWLPRLKIFRSNIEDLEEKIRNSHEQENLEKESTKVSSAKSAMRGTFIHACFEYLHLSDDINADIDHAITQAQNHLVIPFFDPRPLLDEAQQCLHWFLSLPDAKVWLEKGLREQSIIDPLGNMHIVDLLVKTDDMLHVIDYKTGEESPKSHKQQMLRYMNLASEALELPVKGTLVYLDKHLTREVAHEQ